MNDNWISYEMHRPPDVLCEFQRDGKRFVAKPSEFNPAFNVANLYWRMTGIGRRHWDSLPPEAQMQMEYSNAGLLGNILGGALLGFCSSLGQ